MPTETDLHRAPPRELQADTMSKGPGFILAVIALIGSLVAIGLSIGALSNSNQSSGSTARPAAAAPATPLATNVDVTVRDFSLNAAVTTAPGGLIDFSVADKGPTPHEFLIFRADLAPDQLPLGPDGRVDESNASISKVFDSGDNIAVGTTKVFHAALTAGKYVLVCNLPGHYKAGMHTALTVS